jgi:hypothetical protein
MDTKIETTLKSLFYRKVAKTLKSAKKYVVEIEFFTSLPIVHTMLE